MLINRKWTVTKKNKLKLEIGGDKTMLIEKAALISGFLDYLFIIIFCLIGSIVKDTYDTLIGKNTNVNISRVVISAMVSSILIFSISDYLIDKISWKVFILPCFIGGMVGFELLGKITKLTFWINIYKEKGNIIDIMSEDDKNNKNKRVQ